MQFFRSFGLLRRSTGLCGVNGARGFASLLCVLAVTACVSTPDLSVSAPVVVDQQTCGAIHAPAPEPVPIPPLVTVEVVIVDDAAFVATSVADYEDTAVWLGHLGGWVNQAAAWITSAQGCVE